MTENASGMELFQSTLPARGATAWCAENAPSCVEFQSTLPARGATARLADVVARRKHFNPRSPHGERPACSSPRLRQHKFQSTLPARGATTSRSQSRRGWKPFQSTLPARGATVSDDGKIDNLIFQSTLPARGATTPLLLAFTSSFNFNPRSPHGERRGTMAQSGDAGNFNPRSPHGERQDSASTINKWAHFNPRSPHGERPQRPCVPESPHHFNPRSPHGERHHPMKVLSCGPKFQSTLPARGATRSTCDTCVAIAISIHAPRTGSDGVLRVD